MSFFPFETDNTLVKMSFFLIRTLREITDLFQWRLVIARWVFPSQNERLLNSVNASLDRLTFKINFNKEILIFCICSVTIRAHRETY